MVAFYFYFSATPPPQQQLKKNKKKRGNDIEKLHIFSKKKEVNERIDLI
jgi:hypothetical protein